MKYILLAEPEAIDVEKCQVSLVFYEFCMRSHIETNSWFKGWGEVSN